MGIDEAKRTIEVKLIPRERREILSVAAQKAGK
jgi:hypothetical protein